MKRTLLSLLAASSLLAAAPALAQTRWMPIAQRQASLYQRVDLGLSSGGMTPAQAASVRTDFSALVRLEAQYRRSRPGLTQTEIRDLDRRFNVISQRVTIARSDARPDWQPIDQRQATLFQRIEAGVRSGDLTRGEADLLRADFNAIARLEAQYRGSPPGLTAAETAELDRRFDLLSERIRLARNDDDRRGEPRNWRSVGDRETDLDRRIDAGVRQGDLTRGEADRLRNDFAALLRLEAQYRASAPGLTVPETQDLDRRFDALSERIRLASNDDDRRGDEPQWRSIEERRSQLDARIDRAVDDDDLTYAEGRELHRQTAALVRLEADYRASGAGLTAQERADLDRRADDIEDQLRDARRR